MKKILMTILGVALLMTGCENMDFGDHTDSCQFLAGGYLGRDDS